MKKRYITLLLALLALTLGFASCAEEDEDHSIPVKEIVIDTDGVPTALAVGGTVQLSYTISPKDATLGGLQWSSSDKSIAVVSKDGLVTAVAPGEVVITVSLRGRSDSITLTIFDPKSGYVTFDITEKTLVIGETLTLETEVGPETLEDKTLTWISSDESVATVDQGTITAVAPGEATITASLSNGEKAECKITVKDAISVSLTEVLLVNGKSVKVELLNADGLEATWSTSDEEVATVEEGIITAVGPGHATITVTVDNGETATIEVDVKEPLKLSRTSLEMVVGSDAIIEAENTGDLEIKWTSSDEEVVTVTDGTIHAVGVGTTKVTATLSNEEKGIVTVMVKEGLGITPSALSLEIGETGQLELINAGDHTATWSSSDPEVATVEEGTITAVAPGETTITAKLDNGESAQAKVTVKEPFTITPETTDLLVGEVKTLTTHNAGKHTITWSSSDESVAKVEEGKVTGIGEGEAVITATLDNGSTATVKVTVSLSFSIVTESLALQVGQSKAVRVDNPMDLAITWSSADEEIATVDAKGIVTGVADGSTTITATLDNGVTATVKVTVELAFGITTDDMELSVGETRVVRVDNPQGLAITWTSSDDSVATVDQDGVVTAESAGTATITATLDNGYSEDIEVTVTSSFAIETEDFELMVGEEKSIKVTNPYDDDITWTSSDEHVATVDNQGVVAAKGVGTATITAELDNGITATVEVTVKPSVTLVTKSLVINTGESKTIEIENPLARKITWASSDKIIATVDDKGVVTGVTAGKVVITATASTGEELSCPVTVKAVLAPLTLDKTTLTLNPTQVAILKVSGGSGEAIEWSSSDATVASVSSTGKVTALKIGTATITAKDTKTGDTATCEVTVEAIGIRAIQVSPSEMTLTAGYVHSYTLTILPLNVGDVELDIWSDDENIAEATEYKGRKVIWGKTAGGTTIHFATKDRKHEASIKVTVVAPSLESIAITPSAVTMKPSTSRKLSVSISPEEATMPELVWSSSDETIATVDAQGMVKAVANGKVTITATVKGSTITATCAVTVTDETIPDIPGHDL